MFHRITVLTLCSLLGSCSVTEPVAPTGPSEPRLPAPSAPMRDEPSSTTAESISIRFDRLSAELGLTLSITTVGDADGQTTLANHGCCGIKDAQQFVSDVRIQQEGQALPVVQSKSGWTTSHEPGATLTVTYRLPTTGPLSIDSGTSGQMSPIIHAGLFHFFGNQAFLLPIGRLGTDPINLKVDASRVVGEGQFVSSFGPGAAPQEVLVERSQVGRALYLGGPIALTVSHTPSGRIGVVYSSMDPSVQGDELKSDARAVVEAGRTFFDDSQPWYLVSVHGAARGDSLINVGGGTGLTNAFAMFVASDLDFSNEEHREQFRWVLSHEYFHQWNGLTVRVASQPNSDKDDTSVYWFSEGVTEFYAMRLLTRAGLQSPARSLEVFNHKLRRYAQNSKRDVSAKAAGALFWTDADGEQIPYLRGYLAAWYADRAMSRYSGGRRDLDDAMRALVVRSKDDPWFRVDTAFLVSYLGDGMAEQDTEVFDRFVTEGGAMPFDTDSFRPCLVGVRNSEVFRLEFAEQGKVSCFGH